MKKRISIITFLLIGLLINFSCAKKNNEGVNPEGMMFSTNKSPYLVVKFLKEGKYITFNGAYVYGFEDCLGKGTWESDGNKIILSENSSECELFKQIQGDFFYDSQKLTSDKVTLFKK